MRSVLVRALLPGPVASGRRVLLRQCEIGQDQQEAGRDQEKPFHSSLPNIMDSGSNDFSATQPPGVIGKTPRIREIERHAARRNPRRA
jgi:hypothetical protein